MSIKRKIERKVKQYDCGDPKFLIIDISTLAGLREELGLDQHIEEDFTEYEGMTIAVVQSFQDEIISVG